MRRSTTGAAAASSRAGYLETLRDVGAALWQQRGDPRSQYLLALLIVFVGALAAFAHVLEDYLTGDPLVVWDVRFAVWIHEHSDPGLVSFFKVVTQLGGLAFLGALTAAGVVWLLRSLAVDEAVLLVIVAVGIEVVNALLKLLFHRPRPELAFLDLDTYSMPSGHAAGATAIYAVLAFLVARRRSNRVRVLCGAVAVLLAVAVGFSRLYLGAHYLSDVLAGRASARRGCRSG